MTVLKKIGEALFGSDTSDTEYYAYVAEEISRGVIESGLWTRALAETQYNEAKSRARYIALRVALLKQEISSDTKAQADLQEFRNKLDAAYYKGDYATCLNGWWSLANSGDSSAMYSLAYLYAKGQGTAKNTYAAYYWATRAELGGASNVQPLKNELIPQMMSWDIKRADEEAAMGHNTSTQLATRK